MGKPGASMMATLVASFACVALLSIYHPASQHAANIAKIAFTSDRDGNSEIYTWMPMAARNKPGRVLMKYFHADPVRCYLKILIAPLTLERGQARLPDLRISVT